MLLDLTRYRQPTAQFARTFQPSEFGSEGETYEVREPVALAFEIQKDKDRFRLVGQVRTVLQLSCSRCLEGYAFPVDAAFDVRYLPVEEASADSEAEVAEDDLDTSYYRDDQIDLAEMMREQFYLALPMKPLCLPDCKGLCSQCGTNLNGGQCACDTHVDDPRLAALKALQTRRES
jgi:uncharacterized protein